MCNPKGSNELQVVPEDVGKKAAETLLSEIYRVRFFILSMFIFITLIQGGCLDSSAQSLAATFMTLCDKDVSKFLFGPLSLYTYILRISMRFNHLFSVFMPCVI